MLEESHLEKSPKRSSSSLCRHKLYGEERSGEKTASESGGVESIAADFAKWYETTLKVCSPGIAKR